MIEAPLLTPPPALRTGDGVSVVAPASSPKPEALAAALRTLERVGYRVKTYRDLASPRGYLSGTDEQRADELERAFRDPDTRMVLAARGGYGVGRVLDRVDFSLLSANPKIVCGYSDISALHAAVQKRCGLISFHGPNLIDGLGAGSDATREEARAFFDLASGKLGEGDPLGPVSDKRMQVLRPGQVVGRLLGGNLAVFTALVGTPDEPDFAGGILLVEDTGEVDYRVDRLLTQLRATGLLQRVEGVVLGYFSDCGEDGPEPVHGVLRELLEPLGCPVLSGFPAGHEHPNLPLPLGARVRLDAHGGGLYLAQPAVAF